MQLDFEGNPNIAFVDIVANKMEKNWVLDRALKRHEFTMDFRCQMKSQKL